MKALFKSDGLILQEKAMTEIYKNFRSNANVNHMKANLNDENKTVGYKE